jgi:hypothetical protein
VGLAQVRERRIDVVLAAAQARRQPGPPVLAGEPGEQRAQRFQSLARAGAGRERAGSGGGQVALGRNADDLRGELRA